MGAFQLSIWALTRLVHFIFSLLKDPCSVLRVFTFVGTFVPPYLIFDLVIPLSFLVADSRLYNPLFGLSVGRSVGRSVGPSVTKSLFEVFRSCPPVRD